MERVNFQAIEKNGKKFFLIKNFRIKMERNFIV